MLSSDQSSKRSKKSTTPVKVKKPKSTRMDTSMSSTLSKKKKDPNILDITFEEDEAELSLSSSDEENGQSRDGCF